MLKKIINFTRWVGNKITRKFLATSALIFILLLIALPIVGMFL